MSGCSSKANKLRYIHIIRGTPRDIAIKAWEINYVKIKIALFIIYFIENIPLFTDKFKSKKGASVSEDFSLIS